MGFATVITWFGAVLLGLYMLAVWLIENDVTGRGVAPSRLPAPVVFAHLGLAATGLSVWVAFLIFNRKTLAWTAVGILGAVALLGLTMFARWIPVHRGPARPARPPQPPGGALTVPAGGQLPGRGRRRAWAARRHNIDPGRAHRRRLRRRARNCDPDRPGAGSARRIRVPRCCCRIACKEGL